MKTNKQIIWWLLQEKIVLEIAYENEKSNPDIESSLEMKGYISAQSKLINELLEFIDED